MHAYVEHKLLSEIFTYIVINTSATFSDIYVDKSAVGRPGQTMHLNPE
jgi:hypothetical protein